MAHQKDAIFKTTFRTVSGQNLARDSDVTHYGKNAEDRCLNYYIGQMKRRIAKRINYHKSKETLWYLLKHSIVFGHRNITKSFYS